MKLIHLADLHLGKRVNEFSMIEDQEYILRRILEITDDEQPDALLIAGDVYDKAIPSEEAMRLWDRFLIALAGRHIPVLAISGNHDSAVRFADHSALVEENEIYLCPAYQRRIPVHTFQDEYGPVNVYFLPFIRPAVVRAFFPEEQISDYTDAVRVALSASDVDRKERNVLLSHQFVTGAVTCESEEVNVGGLSNVDVSVYEAFDYVALGHLHGPQSVGRETVRYSGTPLKYSFSEKDHKKSVTVVELKEKGQTVIRTIPLKPLHDLRQIRGSFEEVSEGAKEAVKEATGAENDYLKVVLTDEEDVISALSKLRAYYPNIMELSYDNRRTRENRIIREAADVDHKSPLELFEDFFEIQNNQPFNEEQRAYVTDLIHEIWEGEDV